MERPEEAAAEQFGDAGGTAEVRAYGTGNVHQTYLVTPERGPRFLLQRLNPRVFPRPELLLGNLRVVTEHLLRKLGAAPLGGDRRWEVPEVLSTREGRDHWVGPDGGVWRALRFVERARSREAVRSPHEAREVGRALGTFHCLTEDLPPESLADTLPGFHVTPRYLRRYDEVLAGVGPLGSPAEERCRRFVDERRGAVSTLEEARRLGRLRPRPIHGDPKADNVLFDDATGRAVALVDLDTVQPGLLPYDLGDCLRSACNPAGEETSRWEDARFDLDLCRAALRGYFDAAGGSLTDDDRSLVWDAARLIAFELGLRFLTDHLEGDVYFRARRRGHNLERALVQFRLVESIEAQEGAIRALTEDP